MPNQQRKQYYPDVDVELSQSFTKEDWEAAVASIAGLPRDRFNIKAPIDLEQALAYILFDAPHIQVNERTGRYAFGHVDEYDDDWLRTIFMDCRTEKPLGELGE